MQKGTQIIAKMPEGSFYQYVKGTVHNVKSTGWVEIIATEVMSKWDDTFEAHPTTCRTAAKIENVAELA